MAGLLDKLSKGENLVVAEGYLFEFERRGRLKAGAFVPDVSIHRPDLVKSLYEEFVYAGSDVVLAFTVSRCDLTNFHYIGDRLNSTGHKFVRTEVRYRLHVHLYCRTAD